MNEIELSLEQLLPLILDTISRGKTISFKPRGTSMLPMLRQGKDSVTLSAPPARLKKYDLPLYRRDNGQFVLHRIVEVGEESYSCCGDNQYLPETGIRPEQIIALVTGFTRDGKYYSVENPKYKAYCRYWDKSRSLRYFNARAKGRLGRRFK